MNGTSTGKNLPEAKVYCVPDERKQLHANTQLHCAAPIRALVVPPSSSIFRGESEGTEP